MRAQANLVLLFALHFDPGVDHILETNFRLMTEILLVPFILRMALDIHVARVPIALLRRRLRTPVCPDAELGVAEPVWRPVLLEGVPRRLKRPRRDCT